MTHFWVGSLSRVLYNISLLLRCNSVGHDWQNSRFSRIIPLNNPTSDFTSHKNNVFKVLLQNSAKKTFRIWAVNAPIEEKDLLKLRQYRWSPAGEGKHKAWFIELEADQLLKELKFLQSIYPYPICLPVEELNAKNRFSKEARIAEHWIEKPSDIDAILSK